MNNQVKPHANSDLVDLMVRHMKDDSHVLSYVQCEIITQALEYREFDALQHLHSGGKLTDNEVIFSFVFPQLFIQSVTRHLNAAQCDIDQYGLFWQRVMQGELDPYQEPPVEGSREWAMECPEKVSHESDLDCGYWWDDPSTTLGNKKYDNDWSVYVEPRKPGWYWVRSKYNSGLSVWYYNDGRFHTSDNINDSSFFSIEDEKLFHWIGKTRIELEVPEGEL